jgi:hypothetical protein
MPLLAPTGNKYLVTCCAAQGWVNSSPYGPSDVNIIQARLKYRQFEFTPFQFL